MWSISNLKDCVLIIFLITIYQIGKGQALFGVDEPFRVIVKTTDFNTIHDHVEISNLAGQDLDMVAVTQIDGFGGCPSEWGLTLSVPDSIYSPIGNGDSANFTISAVDTFMNKLIIGVDHNGTTGDCVIGFKLYASQDPSINVNVGFDVTVLKGNNTGFEKTTSLRGIELYPNPTKGEIYIGFSRVEQDVRGKIVDNVGRMISSFSFNRTDHCNLNVDGPPGVYFLYLETKGRTNIIKVIKE